MIVQNGRNVIYMLLALWIRFVSNFMQLEYHYIILKVITYTVAYFKLFDER